MANVFFLKIVSVLLVLAASALNWSWYFQELSQSTVVFLCSLVFANFILFFLLKGPAKYRSVPDSSGSRIYWFVSFFFLLNLVYAKEVALVNVLTNSGSYYKDINNVPTLFPLLLAACCYLGIMSGFTWVCTKKRAELTRFFFILAIVIFTMGTSIFIVITLTVLISFFLKSFGNLDVVVIKMRPLVWGFVAIAILSACFVVWKEVRSESNMEINAGDDRLTQTISEFIGVTDNFIEARVPDGFLWLYAYSVSPLYNLDSALSANRIDECRSEFITRTLLPQSVQNRIFQENPSLRDHLVNPLFNVSTIYFEPYYYCGWTGLSVFLLLLYGMFLLGFYIVRKSKYCIPYIGLVSCIQVLGMFGNLFVTDMIFVPFFMMIIGGLKSKKYKF